MSFADRLHAAIEAKGNPCLVGLDPSLELLPNAFAVARDARASRAERARAIADFCCQVVEVVADRVPAVKPQSAYFEQLGADGVAAFELVVATARKAGLIVIGDVKRGDIASTAEAYARASIEPLPGLGDDGYPDAITANAFLGGDSVEPLIAACKRTGRGVFLLVRTSNPGSADFQRHGVPELSYLVAARVAQWGSELVGSCGLSSVGAVVGATHGAELASFRERMPTNFLLLPGYGAQGATAADVVGAFLRPKGARVATGALVNSSRGILFAHREARHAGRDWKDATRLATDAMVADLVGALSRA